MIHLEAAFLHSLRDIEIQEVTKSNTFIRNVQTLLCNKSARESEAAPLCDTGTVIIDKLSFFLFFTFFF